jgi:hypothetical protein
MKAIVTRVVASNSNKGNGNGNGNGNGDELGDDNGN